MTVLNRPSIWRLVAKATLTGLCVSALLNLAALFVTLPDAVIQLIVVLQAVGLSIEIWRATPYHMSAWNPFLINAALYAALVLAVMLFRRRRKSNIPTQAA